MPETHGASFGPPPELEDRVLEIARALASELGRDRAARGATASSSLERDLGLGSIERVELLVRLESAFGRALDDRCLELDTPAALARALVESGGPAASAPLAVAAAVEPARPLDLGSATIHEALARRGRLEPERPHIFLREDDGSEQVVTYGRLLAAGRLVAGGLRERGVRKGETVALMLPTGMDFLAAFQGILLAGAVPVPIYPPVRLDRLEEYAQRQAAILADAGVVLLLTVPQAVPIAGLLRPRVPSLAQVTTVVELTSAGADWPAVDGDPADAAFIQYTSGSTGSPKGVLLTHANLLANIRAIARGVHATSTDVGVSWLPLYHDMGLIGSWLFCMVEGLPLDLQSPLSFLARPERWLWAIHRRRGTLSAAPNFAYELCARRIPDAALEGLDLSCWRCALNGAEPVNPDTLERFARRLAPYGFRREALMPVYGLAENAVALCVPPPGRGPVVDRVARAAFATERRAEVAAERETQPLRFVSVGSPLPEHEVRIVDEAGRDLAERAVGRLVFRGPSMTAGYFRKPEATAAVSLEGGWLDSGDLAYRADGELYLAGRLKDLIIKAGRNLVPQEIEEVTADVTGVRRGCVVAFGVENQATASESLVVVAETRATQAVERDRIAAAVTDRVAAAVGVPPDTVVLVSPGAVPKTSSGKIRRAATREQYLAGALGATQRTPRLARLRLVAGAAWALLVPRLRALSRGLYVAYLALTLLPVALATWALALALPGRRRVFALARGASHLGLRILGCRLSASGLENLSGPGPFLLACNHASYVDIPSVLALLPVDFLFLAKREVVGWPVIGAFVRRCGYLTVDRWNVQQSVADARQVTQSLAAGDSVLIFPEGTFTDATGLRPFRMGVFTTAVETGVPIVPMALTGTRRVLRGEHWPPRPGRIELWVGAPIVPPRDGWRAAVALRDTVAAQIAAHCGEPVLDLVAGGPVRPEP